MRMTIRHTGKEPEELLFQLILGDTPMDPVCLPNPVEYPVEGYDGGLMTHLQWYLEDYLTFPEGGNVNRAEAVITSLEAWGTKVFDALFDRNTYLWYHEQIENLENLQIRVISNSPAVLAWPWEALCDNQKPGARTGIFLSPLCCLERQPDSGVPLDKPVGETDLLRMLLVIARPYEHDVGYHALAREVVDYAREERLPVSIDVLRPPTFDNLRQTLIRAKEENRPYHIFHFDGHGGYGVRNENLNPTDSNWHLNQKFQSEEGNLVFETAPKAGADPEADIVGARDLGQVLFHCGVRMAVLNACQSAMIDGRADDTYASVAASLLNAGIPSVTAMGYSLYVSGAQKFVPAFYKELFQRGIPADAMRAGRNAMFIHKDRCSLTGETPLWDWLVPELYQKLPAGAEVLPRIMPKTEETTGMGGTVQAAIDVTDNLIWPPDALVPDEYGFIGRGQDIQNLERLLQRRTAAGILVHGMAGVGKTALMKGFLSWLRDTGGLLETNGTPCPVFWFDFRDIHSGKYIVEELSRHLFQDGAFLQVEVKLRRVVEYLRHQRTYIVWDNFESASGAPGTAANLPDEDRGYLKNMLEKLKGGKSRVFLTSRTREEWLGRACTRLPENLDGLHEAELYDYCGRIAEALGFTLDPNNIEVRKLLERLEGNPLAIRAILSRMADGYDAGELDAELDTAFRGVDGDESTQRLRAIFRVLMSGADVEMVPVLQTVGLYDYYVDVDWIIDILLNIAEDAEDDLSEPEDIFGIVFRCFNLLESVGLCSHIGQNIYQLHPILRGYLAETYPASEEMRRWFVCCIIEEESHYHIDEQQHRCFISFYKANIRNANRIAKILEMQREDMYLTWVRAIGDNDSCKYTEAEELFLELAEKARNNGSLEYETKAYRNLSILADQKGKKEESHKWAQMAADLWKNTDNFSEEIYDSFGNAAEKQRDMNAAVEFWEKALNIMEADGKPNSIKQYGILGCTAQLLGDNTKANKWFQKLYQATTKAGDLSDRANALLLQAIDAREQGKILKAERLYRQSLQLFDCVGDKISVSQTHWSLGNLYLHERKYMLARSQYTEAVRIARQLSAMPDIANCYLCLGYVAVLEGQEPEANVWWEQAAEMYDILQDDKSVAFVRDKLERLSRGAYRRKKEENHDKS